MSPDAFTALVQRQREAECGPTSLSAALFLMGVDADPKQVMKKAGVKPRQVRAEGFSEQQLADVARQYGATARGIQETQHERGRAFAKTLERSLRDGKVAILCVHDFRHWVLVVGRVDEHFIIMDPDDGQQVFNRWRTRSLLKTAWNEPDPKDDSAAEPAQYYALIIGPRSGTLRWQPTPRFLALCERGAAATADGLFDDLMGICGRTRSGRLPRGRLLYQILERHLETIIDAVDTWAAEVKATRRDVRELYEAYCTVAAATGLRVPARVDETAIVARMTAVMTAYRFYGSNY